MKNVWQVIAISQCQRHGWRMCGKKCNGSVPMYRIGTRGDQIVVSIIWVSPEGCIRTIGVSGVYGTYTPSGCGYWGGTGVPCSDLQKETYVTIPQE